MEVNDSAISQAGSLQVTIIAFDPRKDQGRVKIEELHRERGRYYVHRKVRGGRADAGRLQRLMTLQSV